MKVAFLFEEGCPNYQHTFQVVDALTPAEKDSLDCSISTGLWGLCDPRCGLGADRMDDREGVVARLFLNRAGSMTAFRGPESIRLLAKANVFVALVSSLRPAVARLLHERLLVRDPRYHGFIQALPHAPGHAELFTWLERTVVMADGRVFVVHHGENDEFLADEMLEWVRGIHNWLITITAKHDADFQDSVFDVNAGRERALDSAISSLSDEWQACCEPTLAKLHAVVPEACRELLAAIESLGDVDLDAAACRKVSINLRRCMEILADVLAPPDPAKKGESFQCRLSAHIKARLKANEKYAAYLDAELTELVTRMETLWKLLHKGVHEDWMHTALRPLVLRMVLLIRELLLPVKPLASRLVLEDELFN